jgi:hypothetical protein
MLVFTEHDEEFTPYTLGIIVQSVEDEEALLRMAQLNVTIPEQVRNFTGDASLADAVETLLSDLHEALSIERMGRENPAVDVIVDFKNQWDTWPSVEDGF